MISTREYIQEWQEALELEIEHLKRFGSTKYQVLNGCLADEKNGYTYYAECAEANRIPVGATPKLQWGHSKYPIRILSSDHQSILFSIDYSIEDTFEEAFLIHDPWELLDQLIDRLDEIRTSKKKRTRIKRLMHPTMPNKSLDLEGKSSVAELYARSKHNPVTFVWGPPGTGKTYTLARTAANKYFKGKRVLLLSHSNQAVDLLMTEMTDFIKRKERFRFGDILRYGAQTGERLLLHEDILAKSVLEKEDGSLLKEKESLFEEKKGLKDDLFRSFSKRDSSYLLDVEKKIARLLDSIRQKEMKLLKDAMVIGTTLTKAALDPAIYEQEFDIVIVDEASMAHIPQIAFAATLGKRFIVCGDFKQLPPIASSMDPLVAKWLKEDIFHRAGVAHVPNDKQLHPHLFLLHQQRRMHPDISAFSNQHFYDSLVEDHESVKGKREEVANLAPFTGLASVLVNSSGCGEYCFTGSASGSRMNVLHVFLSFQFIHEAYKSGVRSIGYVTPYRAQAALMNTLLMDLYGQECAEGKIVSATVHRFQGSERDVMVFDSVDSFPFQRTGMLVTGSDSDRLLNVAITRSKGKFIHVSDADFIRSHSYRTKSIHRLIRHQESNGQYVGMDTIGKWVTCPHPRLTFSYARNYDQITEDLRKAEHSIMVSLPHPVRLPNELAKRLITRNPRAFLRVFSKEDHSYLDYDKWIKDGPTFSFILIDDRILWIGIPPEASARNVPPYIAVRLDSKVFAEHLLPYF